MSTITENKKMTYSDYLNINDNNRYEILYGELIMVPAPSTIHQSISRNLEFLIWDFVKKYGIGNVFYAPIDVVFNDDIVLQPDIIFVKTGNKNIICKNAIHGVPDIVIEIISPTSTYHDLVEKKEIYRKYEVPEYWLVFPEEKAIEVLTLENGEYAEFSKSQKSGFVQSKIIKGLKTDIKEVFDF